MLTIVIPTKNNQDLLIQNLQQNFLGRLPESVHVLIHDNSEKESDLIQRTLKGEKQFSYIHEQKSLSVGENFHQSTKFVFTEYFCFLGDDDFIIFSEFQYEAFSGHPILHSRSYPTNSPHLFRDKLKDRNVVIPEPYAVWEYYNQKCSIGQAYDIEINKKGLRGFFIVLTVEFFNSSSSIY